MQNYLNLKIVIKTKIKKKKLFFIKKKYLLVNTPLKNYISTLNTLLKRLFAITVSFIRSGNEPIKLQVSLPSRLGL